MMTGTRTAMLMILCVGLVLGLVAGCGGSSPQVKTANTALQEGDYEEALSKIEQALEEDSADTGAYLLRAKVLRKMADSTTPPDEYTDLHRRAREAEEQALVFDADLREKVLKKRKRVFDREIDRGKLAYNRANKRGKQDLYYRAVASYGAAGIAMADSARPVLNEAFSRLRVGQRTEVIPVLETYVKRADTVSRKAYEILGRLYLANDEGKKAVDLLDEGVRAHPENRDLHTLRLTAYNQAGEMTRALAAYREQIEKRPKNVAFRYNYGALLLEAERYGEAIEQLKQALEIQPDHIGSQYNLGAAYVNAALARDDSIAALEETRGAMADTVASDTSNAVASDTTRQNRMEALLQKREDLFKEAIPPLERVRKMDDASKSMRQDACRALMVAYVQTNRPGKAAQVEECTGLAEADF